MSTAEATSKTPGKAAHARLSPGQVQSYRNEGYLIYPDPILPDDKFAQLKSHFDDKLSRLPADVRPEAMDVPHFNDTRLFDWLFADEVLDLVEPILGPDIALFSSHFICKPKGNGKRVPWHEDSFYWKNMLSIMEVVTVWLAIDPSTTANGCMNVIPRALHGYSEYEPVDESKNVFGVEIKKFQIDEARAVPIELAPNHASLHDGKLMHGSPANTSNLRRCGYTMRYISTRTRLSDESMKYHQLYLARGKDLSGNTYADPSKTYAALARYRESNKKHGH